MTTNPTVEGETEIGLDRNLAAVVAYFFLVFGGLALLAVEDDEYVRFHAAQSTVLTVVFVVLNAALGALTAIVSAIPVFGGPLGSLLGFLFPVLQLAWLLVWAFLLYRAYLGERYELPAIGGVARNLT